MTTPRVVGQAQRPDHTPSHRVEGAPSQPIAGPNPLLSPPPGPGGADCPQPMPTSLSCFPRRLLPALSRAVPRHNFCVCR